MSSVKQIEFNQDYPGVAKIDNANKIAQNLQKKTNRASVPAQLRDLNSIKE